MAYYRKCIFINEEIIDIRLHTLFFYNYVIKLSIFDYEQNNFRCIEHNHIFYDSIYHIIFIKLAFFLIKELK